MRMLLPVAALTLLPGCWPWIPGSANEYKEVDDTIFYGSLERYDYAGDYWEDNDSVAFAQGAVLRDAEDFTWADVYGDEAGCFDTIGTTGLNLEPDDPDIDDLTLLSRNGSIELDFLSDLRFESDVLEGSDVPEHGSSWELLAAVGDDGELRATDYAKMPDAFQILEPDVDGDTIDGHSISSDLDVEWTNANADYYYINVFEQDSGAELHCHTTGTDISIEDNMLQRFAVGDRVFIRVYAVNESRAYLPDYDAMARTNGTVSMVGVVELQ